MAVTPTAVSPTARPAPIATLLFFSPVKSKVCFSEQASKLCDHNFKCYVAKLMCTTWLLLRTKWCHCSCNDCWCKYRARKSWCDNYCFTDCCLYDSGSHYDSTRLWPLFSFSIYWCSTTDTSRVFSSHTDSVTSALIQHCQRETAGAIRHSETAVCSTTQLH